MGRRRTRDAHLPQRMVRRHGSYYYISPEGRWIGLGRALRPALLEYERLAAVASHQYLNAAAIRDSSRRNAKLRGIPYSLTIEDFRALLARAGGRCEFSGIPFSYEKVGNRRPWAPSIDRIDGAKGYTPENCRVVCVAVNLALNSWGDAAMIRMATYIARMHKSIGQGFGQSSCFAEDIAASA